MNSILKSLFFVSVISGLAASICAAADFQDYNNKAWAQHRAARSTRHARTYAQDVYHYSRHVHRVDPIVAKSDSEELGRNITKAQQDIGIARKEAGNDTATVAALKSIEKHLTAAAEQHKMLHMECCKDAVDGNVCMTHCNQIMLELDKAQAEQDALIRALDIKPTKSK
jgi:hypothetical protein